MKVILLSELEEGLAMAFDIYAGGFARYYAREWENVMQKHARETGMQYQMIRPSNDEGPANWEEIAQVTQEWKAAIKQGLGENAPADLDWSEERNAPYFTDRPGWDGYSALVFLAACIACKEPLPDRLPDDALAIFLCQSSCLGNVVLLRQCTLTTSNSWAFLANGSAASM